MEARKMINYPLSKVLLILNKMIEYGDITDKKGLTAVITELFNSLEFYYFDSNICTETDCNQTDCQNCQYSYFSELEIILTEVNNCGYCIGYIPTILTDILKTAYSDKELKVLSLKGILDLYKTTKLDCFGYNLQTDSLDSFIFDNQIKILDILRTALFEKLQRETTKLDKVNQFLKDFVTYNKGKVTTDFIVCKKDLILYRYDIDSTTFETVTETEVFDHIKDIIDCFDLLDIDFALDWLQKH